MERLEFKAAFTTDDTGAITGKAWDFSSPDRVGDMIEPAAFAGAVGKSIPMLMAHDQAQAVGVWDSISVESDGLKVSGKLLVNDVVRAAECRALVRAGGITGLSVGFITTKAAPRRGGGRTIQNLDLVECSLVAVPAHPGARITNIKDLPLTTENTNPNAEIEAKLVAAETKITAAETKAAEAVAALKTRIDGMETKLNRPAIITDKKDEPSAETKAFGDYLRLGDRAPELKTLTVSSDPQGGYLAPAEMSTEFVRDLVQYSPIRALASVRTTGNASVLYPKRTGVTNAVWRGETQAATSSEPTFGQAEVVIREVNTYVDISNQLLADSAGQAEAEVRLALAEDFGQKEGLAFVNGAGTLDPEGLMTNADIGFTVSGAATTLTADGLINTFYALPAAYRNQGTWLMNGSSLAAVRKMKDSVTGAYIWQPALSLGAPESILGRPVVEAVDMPDVGAGTFPVLFGDFSGYRIVDRLLALSILVNPYLLATNGITRVHATRRVGGGVLQAAKFRKVKISA